MDALKTHMLQSHTAIDAVGSVATDCNVGTLVLNHIVPGMLQLSTCSKLSRTSPGS